MTALKPVPTVFTSWISSTAIRTFAFWQLMNYFWQPVVSVINPASNLCCMTVSFRSFKMSQNTYFLNNLCQTQSHSWHLVDSSIALFLQSLTLPNVCVFILSKLLIALMGFPRLDAAFYTETTHERTGNKWNNVRHSWYVVSHCRPPNSRGLKCWLLYSSYWVIWRSIISCNSLYTAISMLEMIQNLLQIYGWAWSSIFTLDLVFLLTIRITKGTGYQPYRMRVVFLGMPIFDSYSQL